MGELLVPIQRHEDEIETALVNLTTVLARAVLYRELSLDSSQISAVVKKALSSLPSTSENVRIHIHPDDYQFVDEVAERFEAKTSVVEDSAIMRGGCKLETRHSLVDFTIEKRFQKAVQDMLSQELDQDTPGDGEELGAMMDDLTDFRRDVLDPGEDEDDGKSG
jgi:flagellar assembly protein FliH